MIIPIYVGYPSYVAIWLHEGCGYTTLNEYFNQTWERFESIENMREAGGIAEDYYNIMRRDRAFR